MQLYEYYKFIGNIAYAYMTSSTVARSLQWVL